MDNESQSSIINSFHSDLQAAKELVYDPCGFTLTDLTEHSESKEYGACSFVLCGKKIQHRVSKITPSKAGQFVTVWKRNQKGITAPFDAWDDLDFMIITARKDDHSGQFIFPKSVLAEKGIITHNGKAGKRGIRVYPPWDLATSKQAEKTQAWQAAYFLMIDGGSGIDLVRAKKLLGI